MLTFERANELFHYEPSSGRLTWKKVTSNRTRAGDEAGSYTEADKYYRVMVDGKLYLLHRVIMLLIKGELSDDEQVDHINHTRTDNRLENLRLTSHMENMQNQSRRITNKTGAVGVHIQYTRKGTLRYISQIYVDKKHIHLGSFDTIEEAAIVRKSAEFLYGYHPNHGK